MLIAESKPIFVTGDRMAPQIRHLVTACAVFSTCVALVVIAGWVSDVPLWKSAIPGAVEMKFNTALCIVAAGIALWCQTTASATARSVGLSLTIAFALMAGATLSQYLFGWDLQIDEFFFEDAGGRYNAFRGRMSPYTAVSLLGLGLALVMPTHRVFQPLRYGAAGIALVLGGGSLVGYAWNAREITTDVVVPPIALNTACVLVALGAGVLAVVQSGWKSPLAQGQKISALERKVIAGFVTSFLLLVLGGGLTYKATTVFADAVELVTHTQEVRVQLGQLYGDLTDAAFEQRNFVITGNPDQLANFGAQSLRLMHKAEDIGTLVSDNPVQTENAAELLQLIETALTHLKEVLAVYQAQGFKEASKRIASGEGILSVQSIHAQIDKMARLEDTLLTERQQVSARFLKVMLASMLATLAAALLLFILLYRGIRNQMLITAVAEKRLLSAKNAAEAAKAEADAANEQKSTFLATMSHEIRTPMNGVLGMLELLSLTQLSGPQHTTVKVIRDSGRALMRIIDDILDFSKLDAQKLAINPEPTSLSVLLEDLRNAYASNASSKGLAINITMDPALGPAHLADAGRLRQILNNFVSNAIKFTEKGRIDISAALTNDAGTVQHVRFCVADTGIGVSEANQRALFKPFAQAELNTARRYGGTGLGLSISTRLAELMGGSVRMVSDVGQGTSMYLDIPLAAVDAALLPDRQETPSAIDCDDGHAAVSVPTIAQAQADRTLVLLVDDHPTNRLLLARQLNLLGYATVSAADGMEALRLWRAKQFGLVLTDCNMPLMDGYELARAIREDEAARGADWRCPVIACTANVLRGEIEICLESGMDDYIAKPVELKSLAEKIKRWIPGPAPVHSPHPIPVARPTPSVPIDHDVLGQMTCGSADLEQEIFAEFQRANDLDVTRLLEAVKRREAQNAKDVAHLIKGASAMVGATALSTVCLSIENAVQTCNWMAAEAALPDLQAETLRLNQYFSTFLSPPIQAEIIEAR